MELRQEVMKMKLKGVDANVHGPVFTRVLLKLPWMLLLIVIVLLEAVIKLDQLRTVHLKPHSVVLEGIFDGMMFHASGTVTTKDDIAVWMRMWISTAMKMVM